MTGTGRIATETVVRVERQQPPHWAPSRFMQQDRLVAAACELVSQAIESPATTNKPTTAMRAIQASRI